MIRKAPRIAATLGLLMTGLTLPAVVLAAPSGGPTPSATYTFVSAPNLHPPKVQVLKRRAGLARGDFVAATTGPLLLDSHARPVWFMPVNAFDLQQETYDGKPVLVWFEGGSGRVVHGHKPGHRGAPPPGKVVIYDEHYRKIATIQARSPWMPDLHDASIIGGDIWITVIRLVSNQDLAPYGGPRSGSVMDVGLQEFQISTGHLIRTWDALNPGGKPNVPLSASEARIGSGGSGGSGRPGPSPWDAYHLNSVQALPNGDLLVSMRNTWSVYLIDPASNRIIWTLGGKDSTFKLGAGVPFSWQHDARLVDPAVGGMGSDVELTLFNDNNGGRGEKPSAGMVLSLNTIARKAALVRAYRHHPPLTAQVLGSMQLLPDGNALVGWGSEPYFSEYSPSGKELLDARWSSFGSYRVLFTDTWVGTPGYPPRGAVRGKTIYASWNGATEVAKWEVLAGSSASHLKAVASHARNGFETAIKLNRNYSAYEVRALTSTGRALGTSKAFS